MSPPSHPEPQFVGGSHSVGIDGHVPSEYGVAFDRNGGLRSVGISGHLASESAPDARWDKDEDRCPREDQEAPRRPRQGEGGEVAKSGYAAAATMWEKAKAAFSGGNLVDAMNKAKTVQEKAVEAMTNLGMEVPAPPAQG